MCICSDTAASTPNAARRAQHLQVNNYMLYSYYILGVPYLGSLFQSLYRQYCTGHRAPQNSRSPPELAVKVVLLEERPGSCSYVINYTSHSVSNNVGFKPGSNFHMGMVPKRGAFFLGCWTGVSLLFVMHVP